MEIFFIRIMSFNVRSNLIDTVKRREKTGCRYTLFWCIDGTTFLFTLEIYCDKKDSLLTIQWQYVCVWLLKKLRFFCAWINVTVGVSIFIAIVIIVIAIVSAKVCACVNKCMCFVHFGIDNRHTSHTTEHITFSHQIWFRSRRFRKLYREFGIRNAFQDITKTIRFYFKYTLPMIHMMIF